MSGLKLQLLGINNSVGTVDINIYKEHFVGIGNLGDIKSVGYDTGRKDKKLILIYFVIYQLVSHFKDIGISFYDTRLCRIIDFFLIDHDQNYSQSQNSGEEDEHNAVILETVPYGHKYTEQGNRSEQYCQYYTCNHSVVCGLTYFLKN